MRYNNLKKQELVSRYYNGKSVTEICEEHQIPRSTFYSWIQAYRPIESKNGVHTVTPKDFDAFSAAAKEHRRIHCFL